MPHFKLILKRRLIDTNGKLMEPGMWAEVSHINPRVPWGTRQLEESVVNQFKMKYNVDIHGKVMMGNFDEVRIS